MVPLFLIANVPPSWVWENAREISAGNFVHRAFVGKRDHIRRVKLMDSVRRKLPAGDFSDSRIGIIRNGKRPLRSVSDRFHAAAVNFFYRARFVINAERFDSGFLRRAARDGFQTAAVDRRYLRASLISKRDRQTVISVALRVNRAAVDSFYFAAFDIGNSHDIRSGAFAEGNGFDRAAADDLDRPRIDNAVSPFRSERYRAELSSVHRQTPARTIVDAVRFRGVALPVYSRGDVFINQRPVIVDERFNARFFYGSVKFARAFGIGKRRRAAVDEGALQFLPVQVERERLFRGNLEVFGNVFNKFDYAAVFGGRNSRSDRRIFLLPDARDAAFRTDQIIFFKERFACVVSSARLNQRIGRGVFFRIRAALGQDVTIARFCGSRMEGIAFAERISVIFGI